jgi:phage gp36-like protein
MYCTRADIEQKRIPQEHLLELVDDQRTGEFYDGAGAVPPSGNTLPLYSDAASPLNVRVSECIEDACNEIDAYLSGIYLVPIAVGGVPAIVNTIAVNISSYYLYARRGNSIPDVIKALYDGSVQMLKQFAARKISLPIPKVTDPALTTQSAFAVRTRPSVFADIPY